MALLPESGIVSGVTTGHISLHYQLHRKINRAYYDLEQDYGAVASEDGGTDATAAIQAALNDATVSRVPIRFPPNKTFIVTGLTAAEDRMTVYGAGWSSVLQLAAGANTYALTVGRADQSEIRDFRIQDLRIECNSGSQTAGGGINLVNASRPVIDRLSFQSPYHAGLTVSSDASGNAWSSHLIVRDCLFGLGNASPDAANTGYALDLANGEESWIHGNNFGFNGRAHIREDVVGNNSIIGNTFVAGGIGITSGGSRGRWIGNIFDRLGNSCFDFSGANNAIIGNSAFAIGDGGTAGAASAVVFNWQAARNRVIGNFFQSHSTNGQTRSIIREAFDNTQLNIISGNAFEALGTLSSGVTERFATGTSPTNLYRDNVGYVTESKGTATVTSAATSVVVTHGLGLTPALADILVTPTNSLGSAAKYWVSTPTSTQFTINVNAAPGATTATFAWQVQSL